MSRPSPSRSRLVAAAASAGALVVGGLVALAAAPAAQAFNPSCDPPKPALKTMKVSPAKVNVKSGARTVTVSGTTTGPALSNVYVTGQPVKGGTFRSGFQSKPKAHSFAVKVVVPKGAAKGVHEISIDLASADASRNYWTTELAGMPGVAHRFTVTSKPDKKAPVIKKIKLSRSKVNTKKKAAKVTMTVTARDAGGSGVGSIWIDFKTKSGRHFAAAAAKKKGKFVGTLTVPTWATTSTATVTNAYIADRAGNYTMYGQYTLLRTQPRDMPEQLRPTQRQPSGLSEADLALSSKKLTKAMKPKLKIVSKKDAKKPKVGAASVSPKSVKVGERRWQVNYSAKVTDSQSGVAWVDTWLESQDTKMITAHSSLQLKKGTWKGTGIIDCWAMPGTYSLRVTAYDRAGNQVNVLKEQVTFTG